MRKQAKNSKPMNEQRRAILDFARDHDMVIHPGGGFEYYVTNFAEAGHCPCDRTRPVCPCPEAVEEVEEDGWCKCKMYWRDLDTYKKSHVPEEKD